LKLLSKTNFQATICRSSEGATQSPDPQDLSLLRHWSWQLRLLLFEVFNIYFNDGNLFWISPENLNLNIYQNELQFRYL